MTDHPAPQEGRNGGLRRPWWLPLLFVGGTAVALLAYLNSRMVSPEAAVSHFLGEVSAGNYFEAWAEGSAALRKVQTFDQFHAAASSCPWLRQIKDIDFTTRSVTGDSAQAGGTLTFADGTRAPAFFSLAREIDRDALGEHHAWRLTAYRIAARTGSPGAAPFAADANVKATP